MHQDKVRFGFDLLKTIKLEWDLYPWPMCDHTYNNPFELELTWIEKEVTVKIVKMK